MLTPVQRESDERQTLYVQGDLADSVQAWGICNPALYVQGDIGAMIQIRSVWKNALYVQGEMLTPVQQESDERQTLCEASQMSPCAHKWSLANSTRVSASGLCLSNRTLIF